MEEKMPSQEEQNMVAWYVLKRPLIRPNTSYRKAAFCIAAFVAVSIVLYVSLYSLSNWLGVFYFLPEPIRRFWETNETIFFLLLGFIFFLIAFAVVAKRAAIGAIRLYQRYTPEDVRRRCLLKPTCSEYAILVINKYGLIRGIIMTHKRLNKKCRGRIYRIDEP